MQHRLWASLSLALFAAVALGINPLTAWAARGELQIYFIDVEGGQSTLFVSPAGQSLLVDTGWPGFDGRDAKRIAAAAKDAGLSKIDYVLITHYHVDHAGGIPQLVAQIPVGTFVDHGPNFETNPGVTETHYENYRQTLAAGKYKHLTLRPGDVLPISGMKVTAISSNGDVIDHPFPGGGESNPYCKNAAPVVEDKTENSRSLGILINFGKLKILDLGDLTRDREFKLMCPVNPLGKIDILVVSHHGSDLSSSPELVDAIHPRVAIMDNGAKKGGSTSVLDTVRQSPGLETLWQLHFSEEGGDSHNVSTEYIANPQGPDAGNYLMLTASPHGSFTIFNSRTKQTKDYAAK
jgi:beta-lactamase superfamily II metal-dependent hydrolase